MIPTPRIRSFTVKTKRIRKEVYMLLRQIVRKAYELDYIKKDVSQFVQLGKIEKADGRALTVDEQRRILTALGDDPFSRRVLLYLVTGVRPGELRRINRKDTRPNYIKIEGTKNSRAVRWVKVSPKIVELMRSLPGGSVRLRSQTIPGTAATVLQGSRHRL